jgi:hypothetical protein
VLQAEHARAVAKAQQEHDAEVDAVRAANSGKRERHRALVAVRSLLFFQCMSAVPAAAMAKASVLQAKHAGAVANTQREHYAEVDAVRAAANSGKHERHWALVAVRISF